MFTSHNVQEYQRNAILRAMPLEDAMRIVRGARKVRLEAGCDLYAPGESLNFIYFPVTCVVSHSYTTSEGTSASMALTGNDGIVGLPLLLCEQSAPHNSVVQIGGHALRVPAAIVQAEFARCALLRQVVLRYTYTFITQLAQTAACNRLHPLEQRLCRWLALCHDRVRGDEVMMTQESMASIVGSRRESVTLAAGHLQDLGIIRYTRGRIQILDRSSLEGLACECYGILVNESDRVEDVPRPHRHRPREIFARPPVRTSAAM